MDARIDNFSAWINYTNNISHKNDIEFLLNKAGFTILNFMEHEFKPQGYTSIWLLAESHCALHTFPEDGKTYIELSSCNLRMYESFKLLFYKKFQVISSR